MRTLWIYLALLIAFAAAIFSVLHVGQQTLTVGGEVPVVEAAKVSPAAGSSLWKPLADNLGDPLSRLFLQLIVILLATRAVGALFTRFGQPAVVGEVIAGIVLGPSLLGWVWPQAQHFLFPQNSLGVLRLLSQVGVCLFMFVVGLELEVEQVRRKARQAVLVSHVGILFPFLLGTAASLMLYPTFAARGTSFIAFALFMGIALSITAFPVLARILKERRMERSFLGATAITCAAIDDATAWIALAFVIAIARATNVVSTAVGLGCVVTFVALMFFLVRPKLPRLLSVEAPNHPAPTTGILVAVLLIILGASFTTELIGVHAMFGAFIAGVAMPSSPRFREFLTVRLETFSAAFLLPLFFAFSGLRTQMGLMNDGNTWLVCLAVIAIATLGKLGGSMMTARWTGLGWNDSFVLGALMNTRGLVELVALNVGYDLGILPPRIFAIMVVMAVVTTLMTGPLLNLAARWKSKAKVESDGVRSLSAET